MQKAKVRLTLGGLCLAFIGFGQQVTISPPLGAGRGAPGSNSLATPEAVVASDGIYDKFILVRWEPSEGASQYKVFRTTNPQAPSFQEVSNGWQKSTWLCDYSALPNVDYFYSVVASNGKSMSKLAPLDKGFLRKATPIAGDPPLSLASNEALGTARQVFLLMGGVQVPDQDFLPGAAFEATLSLKNIFDAATPLTDLRFFLSIDEQLDWDDPLLLTKTVSSLPPDASLELTEKLTLPSGLLPGKYFLLAVSSSEGDVLNSKIALTALKIIQP